MIYIWVCPNLAGFSSNGVPTPRRTIFFWRYAEKWHHSSCGSRIQDAPIMDDYIHIYIYTYTYIYIHTHTGWWFGTFFIFHSIWDVILPIDFHIFQRGRYTTNQHTFPLDSHDIPILCSHSEFPQPFFQGLSPSSFAAQGDEGKFRCFF